MALISIASTTIPNWNVGSDVQLRIYPLQSFVAADGTIISAGIPSEDTSQNENFYLLVDCTLVGTSLTIAACTLESTTDSQDNPSAEYGAYFFTTEGQRICAFAEYAAFSLPASPTSTTWSAIAVAQESL